MYSEKYIKGPAIPAWNKQFWIELFGKYNLKAYYHNNSNLFKRFLFELY